MKNLNWKYFGYILLGISAISFIGFFYFKPPEERTLKNSLLILPNVLTIDTGVILIFCKWLWKWKWLKGWLVPFPNLNGTWKGLIQSTWEDPETGERPDPIPAILTINQSFLNISCVMRTEEMCSRSFISDFHVDGENQVTQLSYSYNSHPNQLVIERSSQHLGTMLFDIVEKPKLKLTGQYWTGRKTTGNIEMKFWKKEKLDYFPNNLGKHPVSEVRNYKS